MAFADGDRLHLSLIETWSCSRWFLFCESCYWGFTVLVPLPSCKGRKKDSSRQWRDFGSRKSSKPHFMVVGSLMKNILRLGSQTIFLSTFAISSIGTSWRATKISVATFTKWGSSAASLNLDWALVCFYPLMALWALAWLPSMLHFLLHFVFVGVLIWDWELSPPHLRSENITCNAI